MSDQGNDGHSGNGSGGRRYDFDLITIGAGSGGVRASRVSARMGARVAVVEESRLGGTCVNVGCVPKKLMVMASHFGEDFEHARGFGWSVGTTSFDWKTFRERKDEEIGRLNGVYERLLHGAGVEIIRGRGRMVDPHTVEVTTGNGGSRTVTAETILIATGGRPRRTSEPGADLGMVSDDVFYLEEMPKRLIVAGGGYIAVEMAGIFQGLGADVHLIYRGPHILRGFDDDCRFFVTEEMRKKGIEFTFNQIIDCIDRRSDGSLEVTFSRGRLYEVDAVLYAIGRDPNVEGLGLENAGVELERGAVKVDDYSRTSMPNIYAIGDVTDRMNLTPVAIREGMAFAQTVFGGTPTPVDHDRVPTAVFSQPPMGTVGMTEASARSLGRPLDVYTTDFRPMKHTLSGSEERTFMKVIVDRESDRVLGVHMVGLDAPEIIQGIGIAVKAGCTKADFDRTVGIHPTAAEELVTMSVKQPDPQDPHRPGAHSEM
jgi:glutathione reductase (NADPH)